MPTKKIAVSARNRPYKVRYGGTDTDALPYSGKSKSFPYKAVAQTADKTQYNAKNHPRENPRVKFI